MNDMHKLLNVTANKWYLAHLRPIMPVLRGEIVAAAWQATHANKRTDSTAQAERIGHLGSAGAPGSRSARAGEGQGTGLYASEKKEVMA